MSDYNYERAKIKNLSAVILYKNEEDCITRAIDNVYSHVNEIILCDDSSDDGTYELCKNYSDPDKKIFNIRLPKAMGDVWGIVDKKNFCLAWVSSWWVLLIDSDEYFEKEFFEQLSKMLTDLDYDVYAFPRKNLIDGVWLKERKTIASEKVSTYPDHQLRLFRARLRYVGSVHEELVGYRSERCLYIGSDGPHIIHDKTSTKQHIQDIRYQKLDTLKTNFRKFKFMDDISMHEDVPVKGNIDDKIDR